MKGIVGFLLLVSFSTLLGSCTRTGNRTAGSTSSPVASASQASPARSKPQVQVPAKALLVLKYIRLHHSAPEGYVGSRQFGNFEGRLPELDSAGKRIIYQEWDINPHHKGLNRGAERLITGSDLSAYYTPNHYQVFIPLKDVR